MLTWLRAGDPFPELETALADPNGLLAAGATLTPSRLLDAYRRGIFPWSGEGEPLLWWSPDPRLVLFTEEFKPSRSLRRRLRSMQFEIRINTAFSQVIEACAVPREVGGRTWITRDIRTAYEALHRQGYVHSVEAWRNGVLVGGLYGVALGRVFFGESMFTLESDASKVAFAHLVAHLRALDVPLLDCQQETHHLASLGARPIPRSQFAMLLRALIHSLDPSPGWPNAPIDGTRP